MGVQRTASKKRPWQALLKVPGRKRLNVGSFREAEDAAECSGQGAGQGFSWRSPRKSEEAGCAQCRLECQPSHVAPALIPTHSHCRFLTRTCTVKQSTANVLEPLSQFGTNHRAILQVSPALAPLGARGVLAASAPYMLPYSSALCVQIARQLPPGPLPQGVAALGLAVPSQQQS